jgi:hypothetical protein
MPTNIQYVTLKLFTPKTSRGTAVETYPGQAESNNVSAVDYDYDKYTAATTNRVTHRDADISVSVPYQNTMYEPAATTTSKVQLIVW